MPTSGRPRKGTDKIFTHLGQLTEGRIEQTIVFFFFPQVRVPSSFVSQVCRGRLTCVCVYVKSCQELAPTKKNTTRSEI